MRVHEKYLHSMDGIVSSTSRLRGTNGLRLDGIELVFRRRHHASDLPLHRRRRLLHHGRRRGVAESPRNRRRSNQRSVRLFLLTIDIVGRSDRSFQFPCPKRAMWLFFGIVGSASDRQSYSCTLFYTPFARFVNLGSCIYA